MKWILIICAVVIFPSMFLPLWNETKMKKNIILGVTLPSERQNDPHVLALCATYRRNVVIIGVILLISMIPMFFITSDGVMLLYFMVWIILSILLPYLPLIRANTALAAYKREQGWSSQFSGTTVVDLKAIALPRKKLSFLAFLPALLLCFVPNVLTLLQGETSGYAHATTLMTAPLILLFYGLYRIIHRQRAEVVNDNTSLSLALTQLRRYNWGKMHLYMSYFTALFFLGMFLFRYHQTGILILTFCFLAAVMLVAIRMEMHVRSAQRTLTLQADSSAYVDEDNYWLWGIIYHNPNDRRFMVNNRVGVSMSLNAGRPAGKVVLLLSAVLILALPFFGIWVMQEERTPVSLEVTDHAVIAYHTGRYVVELEDIEQAYLLDALPAGTSRTMGTGMDTLYKGRFYLPGIGGCEVNLDPTVPPFLVIETAEERYVFGAREPGETTRTYELLTKALS